ncbi:hypothetical protein BG015_010748 [Linnemannia schmuckeri]|uniref:Uncharacterized protein n=1 Tax=Linnemannia schmuckeri TaxID=64567 RepID=A0A9P5RX33_9FUNG|nr:hypothetical protein BG015_010748 [Linnemannia schmuckeri]
MASRISKVYDMDMPAAHSEYSYPITNITYHLPESPRPERGEAAAQKAFQRILDSYGENERLADAFQVELDKRTRIANERKAEERRIRTERQRQAREEKRNKKQSRNHKAVVTTTSNTPTTTATATPPPGGLPASVMNNLSVQALAQAFQPRHGRFAAAGYSLVDLERRPSIDHVIAANSSGRSRQSSIGSLYSCSSTNTTNTSAHEGTGGREAQMVDSRLSLSASDSHPPHSPPLLDVHGHHHHSSHPADRSLSSTPILPLTPSPRLHPASDTTFGVVAHLPSILAATSTTTSTTTVFPASSAMATSSSVSDQPNISSSSTSPSANNKNISNTSLPKPPPQQQHPGSSTLPMRNKRKQAIPVHPSVIKRIPGITFRIQPDLDKHLQVEILKNIEDYQSTTAKDVYVGGGHSSPLHTNMDRQQKDDTSQLQASQDLSKIQQSITSSRPGYASLYIPDDSASYDDPYLQDYRETSPHAVALHAAPNNNVNTTRYHPYQQHSRNGSVGNVHNVSIHTPTNLRSRSSSSANIWAPYAPSAAGLAMLLSDVVAARATLPLSWDNFSTRDCQVNKVVGKNGQDFEQLEAVVQETVARHQAVAAVAQQEADEEIQENGEADEMAHKPEQKSSTAAVKEPSGSSGDASRKRKGAPVTTPPPSAAAPPSQASAQGATGSRSTRSRTTHHPEGVRSSRTGATDLVEGYDDIERILKEKRQKKREQQKRRDSQSRGVSEATTEGDYDLDVVDMEYPRIKEDVDMDDRSTLLRGYTESDIEGSNSRTHSKRGTTKPPSPPHSRQVTPAAKGDLGSSLHHHAHLGSSLSRTPPTTPTRASTRHPQHTDTIHQDAGAESTATTPVSKTRARAQSFSTTIPTDAKTNFFESALEMIEAKRRQSIAKKKASAVVNSGTTAAHTDSQQDRQRQQQVDEQQQQANRQLEQELANETSQKMMVPNSNIPKSSKYLPGRVLRKPRVRNYDGSDVEIDHQDGGSTSASATTSAEVIYDRDCSSCRLDVTDVDRELWKQARQSGEIHLNPKTWGRTAILCSPCRTQYRRHGLRCTQCFYVPVWNPESTPALTPIPDEGSTSTSAPVASVAPAVGSLSVKPKPGGTCKRCKAGTWFKEV